VTDDPPPVSVVVCTGERPALLRDALESILRGDRPPDELVVVDRSATPQPAFAEDGRLRYVHAPGRGLSRARNVGVAAASHPLLAFCADDAIAADGWLRALVDAVGAESDRRVATGQVAPSTQLDERPRLYRGRIDRDPLVGGSMAIYRSAFEAVGAFDERLGPGAAFPSAEDDDLGLRLLELGYAIAYVPEATVYRRALRPRSSDPMLRWRCGRGKGGFYGKHLHLGENHVGRRARRDVGDRLRHLRPTIVRRPGQALGELAYLAGIGSGLAQWALVERRRDPAPSELHDFLLWENARFAEERILADLAARFRIREVHEIRWSADRFARNLVRFYGTALPPGSDKERHIGSGAFLLVLVEDDHPSYGLRRNGGRVRRVNTRVLAAKQRYRGWTGGGHRVHASIDPAEAARDLFLLLGRVGPVGGGAGGAPLELDIVGDRGWRDLAQLETAIALAMPLTVEADTEAIRMRVRDVWWAAALAGAEPPDGYVQEARVEVDVDGERRLLELRAQPPGER
jgi:glycosyltransferase involved in cell wall biosynthesis